jgi:hypothetical protein
MMMNSSSTESITSLVETVKGRKVIIWEKYVRPETQRAPPVLLERDLVMMINNNEDYGKKGTVLSVRKNHVIFESLKTGIRFKVRKINLIKLGSITATHILYTKPNPLKLLQLRRQELRKLRIMAEQKEKEDGLLVI